MSIQTNVSSSFTVEAFVKLTTVILVIEKIQPGSINYLMQETALLADNWRIIAQVNDVKAAQKAFKEFSEWLNETDQPEEPDGSDGYVTL